MNFDERDSHWESFLQDKANLSISFQKDSCCKVCLCLELLKLSSCTGSCYRPQEEADLIDRLLQGIMDPQTFKSISDRLKLHFTQLNFVSTLQDRLFDLENSVKKYNQKIIELNISSQLEKFNKSERSSEVSKLDSIIKRIEAYEDTLVHLRKENEDLRGQLKKAISIHEEYLIATRKSASEIRGEFEFIREEQNKIRAIAETLTRSLNENAMALKELRNSKENPRDDSEFKAFKLQIAEEVRDFNEKTQMNIKKIQDSGSECEKKIDETWSQIQDLKKEHEATLGWQQECKTLSRHSSHLLSASDSVYSSLQQMQDFNHYLETKLESLKKELEVRGNERRNSGIEEFMHPGNYGYDEEIRGFCWSCCKASQDVRGCQRKLN